MMSAASKRTCHLLFVSACDASALKGPAPEFKRIFQIISSKKRTHELAADSRETVVVRYCLSTEGVNFQLENLGN